MPYLNLPPFGTSPLIITVTLLIHNTPISSLCYAQFAEGVFGTAAIALHIQQGISEWILYERTSIPSQPHPQRPLIVSLISHLQRHAQYTSLFESHYLTLTTTFYTAESTEKASGELEAEKFLVHCELRREEEGKRAREMMPKESWKLVRERTDKGLLEGRLKWLVEGGECLSYTIIGCAGGVDL